MRRVAGSGLADGMILMDVELEDEDRFDPAVVGELDDLMNEITKSDDDDKTDD